MRNLQQKLSIARGERPAERLFKNANLINVLSGEIYRTHIAVDDGRVVGMGDYQAKQVIDLKGAYVAVPEKAPPKVLVPELRVSWPAPVVPKFMVPPPAKPD